MNMISLFNGAGEESGDLTWDEECRYWWKLNNVEMLDQSFKSEEM